jgi:hypothetical protein
MGSTRQAPAIARDASWQRAARQALLLSWLSLARGRHRMADAERAYWVAGPQRPELVYLAARPCHAA